MTKLIHYIKLIIICSAIISCNTTVIKKNSPEDLEKGLAIIDSFHLSINTSTTNFQTYLHERFYDEAPSRQELDSTIVKLYSNAGIFVKDSVISYQIVTYSNEPERDEYYIKLISIYTNDTVGEGCYLLNQRDILKIARIDINFK